MAQTSASTDAGAVFTINYEPILRNTISQMMRGLAVIRRESEMKGTRSHETQFALKTQQGNTGSFYGEFDPSQFDTNSLESAPEYVVSRSKYKKMWAPYRFRHEIMREATEAGAHFDVLEEDLDDLAQSTAHLMEWLFHSSAGNGYICRVNAADPDASATMGVDSYGGWDNQDLSLVLENLNLEGRYVQFVSAAGAAPRDSGAASLITSVDEVNSTVTFDSAVGTGVADNDYMVIADSNVTTGVWASSAVDSNATRYPVGLPGLVDDYTNLTTFQEVTSATAPRFKAKVNNNGGVSRPLTEALLQKAISVGRVRQPGKMSDKPEMKRWHFFTHDYLKDQFSLELTADRRYTSPLLGRTGVKTYAGFDIEDVLTFDGVPFECSQLALPQSVFLVDTKNLFWLHNGTDLGQFALEPGGGGKFIRVDGTPNYEVAWWLYGNWGARQRSSMYRLDDLETMSI